MLQAHSYFGVSTLPKTCGRQKRDLTLLKGGFNPNIRRPIPTKFVSEARARGKYLQNEFVDSNLFLDELAIKDIEERAEFYKTLPGILDRFPQDFCVHKHVCCAF
jgi:SCY1-like protein 1